MGSAVCLARRRSLHTSRSTPSPASAAAHAAACSHPRSESGAPDVRPGGGESRRQIRARTRAAVERLAREQPGGRIALVVHLGVIRALVPGAELANAERIEVTLDEILAARDESGAAQRTAL